MQISDKNREARGIALTAIICAVLQLAIAPNVGLGNGRAHLGRAVVCGFFAGLFYDLSTTGPIGLMALLLSVCGFALGGEGRNRLSGEFASGILLFVVADLVVNVGYGLGLMLAGQGGGFVDAVFLRALPGALLSLVCFLPFAYFESRIRTSGPSLGGGHFKRGL